jgi:hypothetical protein
MLGKTLNEKMQRSGIVWISYPIWIAIQDYKKLLKKEWKNEKKGFASSIDVDIWYLFSNIYLIIVSYFNAKILGKI